MSDFAKVFGDIANSWEFLISLIATLGLIIIFLLQGPNIIGAIRGTSNGKINDLITMDQVKLLMAQSCRDCEQISVVREGMREIREDIRSIHGVVERTDDRIDKLFEMLAKK